MYLPPLFDVFWLYPQNIVGDLSRRIDPLLPDEILSVSLNGVIKGRGSFFFLHEASYVQFEGIWPLSSFGE